MFTFLQLFLHKKVSPNFLRFPFRFSGSLNSLTTSIGAYHIPFADVWPSADRFPQTRPDECQGLGSRDLVMWPNDRLFVDQEMEVRWQRATCEPLEATEPLSVSQTNSDSGTPPTASPPRRLGRVSCASRFPGSSESIHGPSVQILLEVERRWQAGATYACDAASGGSCPSAASVGERAVTRTQKSSPASMACRRDSRRSNPGRPDSPVRTGAGTSPGACGALSARRSPTSAASPGAAPRSWCP
jgi:hypothetical protein